ncbi:hypothetical protein [Oharaeibacter diazotrophicus]|uniref:hypothetical protein n=1 Tax=Oharaeibacter diazotrophicus TaxID=1920512 RepID=UPI000F84730E|nr:hypothetical protein [Oharaeibacter diazotrophicus]GLS75932.1 hypothetical protein GCM10007904_12670 [Oharaeibacter diazotrophicus]
MIAALALGLGIYAACAIIGFLIVTAMAADAPPAPSSTVVDLTPITSLAIQVIVALLGILAAAAADRLRRWLKIEEASRANALLHTALDRIVAGALATAQAEVGKADLSLDVRSRAAARAINASQERLPDLLRQTGATPGKLAGIIADKLNVQAARG